MTDEYQIGFKVPMTPEQMASRILELEAQLCRAREVIDKVREDVDACYEDGPPSKLKDKDKLSPLIRSIHKTVIVPESSPGPCRHEEEYQTALNAWNEEINRRKEAEQENARLREIIVDTGIHDSSCKVDEGDECSCYLAELRRRAGMEGAG